MLKMSNTVMRALGTAAVLLLALYFLGRIVVFAAVVNATLWERRSAQQQVATGV